ncbi:glycosyltransferase [Fertoebacter nigrum]|uniref:Glycosyltransferase n=1 Tax=Fertoeibacter niger TaxID=2656921 RepID=A0A8X8GY90_9RHOB|nr:glycosyltransferase [Fertoeibacter niger]NUB46518.1 glycosyltransferase [Fertoeibacter niger]
MAVSTGSSSRPLLAPRTAIEDVRRCDLFDASWYMAQYPDVARLGMDPAEHYLWLGARLGRDPSPAFDSKAYLKLNPDVARVGMNPLLHYLRHGLHEGRWVVPVQKSDVPPRGKPVLNWVMNPDNVGWAYGNNARMLAPHLPEFEHVIDGTEPGADLALYFDIKIFKMRGVLGQRNVLRVGGPRPIELAYGDDFARLRADLSVFDSVIVLNGQLQDLLSPLHANVHLIPNALDLDDWAICDPRSGDSFTVGFAGNLTTSKERKIKGYDFVEDACKALDLPLLHFGKGAGQIAREDMRAKFYSQIDCLVHPVAPGKEGCSNVIMEALALGVPVITTRDAGFHAERIPDGEGILYCKRDQHDIARQIERLRDTPGLAATMRAAARRFAENYHNVRRTAPLYRRAFTPRNAATQAPPRVHFVPFWEPAADFASSRLRCAQPVKLLAGSAQMHAALGFAPEAEVVIVSQLASDATYDALMANPQITVIYDVCDRYYDDDRQVGGVHAKTRFFQLAERATVIIASTVALKREITALGLARPVVCIQDGIDYLGQRDASPSPADGPVVWYGNAGRNNFESARWMIDHVMQNTERGMRLITRKRHFNHVAKTENKPEYAAYGDVAVDWAYDSFVADLRACSICLLSHSPEENTKSPNRLITAIANGVPVIVTSAPSCEALLRAGGMDYAIVRDKAGLDRAMTALSAPAERQRYLQKMQGVIERRFGDVAIREQYEALLRHHVVTGPGRAVTRRLKVMFVSHNMNVGEGAPTSLMQTVLGLKAHYDIDPVVFSVMPGALEEEYRRAGIEVIVPDFGARSRLAANIIARTHEKLGERFREDVRAQGIDVVVVNTATCLWFAKLAEDMGVPTLAMIRESSQEHVNFTFGPELVMEACRAGLEQTGKAIFVSEHTRELWRGHHGLQRTALIPNGIDLAHFDTVRAMDKAALRASLGQPADGVLLVSVGSINARKAQADILEAIAALPEDLHGTLRLALVGAKPSEYLDQIKARIATLPSLAGRVHIEPETHDVALWYRAADAFVFASKNESYPRVIVEAMSFGLPIVSSAVFGTQEQIVDGESGLLYPPGDIAHLTRHLHRLLTDGRARAALAESAATRFWELVTYREMVHQYFVLIRQAVAEKSGEPARPVTHEGTVAA